MKISWGVGITITIIVFTLITLSFVYLSFGEDVNLVRDNYYEAELNFNQKRETQKRTDELTEKLLINLSNNNIGFVFPSMFTASSINGEILLYRPSDRELDINLPIDLDSTNTMTIPTQKLNSGLWKIQVEWNADSLSYFNEKIIMVQ